MSNRTRQPKLTNKALIGLELLLDKPPLMAFLRGEIDALGAIRLGLTDYDLEHARRARSWVRDMVRYRAASGALFAPDTDTQEPS